MMLLLYPFRFVTAQSISAGTALFTVSFSFMAIILRIVPYGNEYRDDAAHITMPQT
jgi:hypothetical protein